MNRCRELDTTDELRLGRGQVDQGEIAASEHVAIAFVATDPPHLRLEKRGGLQSVSVGEVEQVVRRRTALQSWRSAECSGSQESATVDPAATSAGACSASRCETTRPAGVSTWNCVYIPRYTSWATVPTSREPPSPGRAAGRPDLHALRPDGDAHRRSLVRRRRRRPRRLARARRSVRPRSRRRARRPSRPAR